MSNVGKREAQDWLVAFGKAVREQRLKLKLSQEALGFRCGLDRTYVSGIERGVRNPTLVTLMKLALGLEMTASRLIERASAAIAG